MAASKQATSEDGNIQPAATDHSDGGAHDDSAAAPSSMQGNSSNDEEKNNQPQETRELDRIPSALHKTEQVSTCAEPGDEAELEVLLCLLDQRLSTPTGPPTDEQNQQLWDTLRALVPKYKDYMRIMRRRITELEERLEENQRESLRWREHHLEEHRQRLASVIEDYERQHSLALERASNARQQAESLLLQLADAQAEIKRLEAEMHSKIEQLKGDHLRELQALAEEKEAQLRSRSLEYQEEAASYRNLQQQNLADKAKHDAEVASLLHEKVELEARLKGQESLNQDLMSVLEKERSLNQELTAAMGQHDKKIAQLEHQVYKLQSQEKHKDMLIEVLSSKVSQDATLRAEVPGGHQSLPQNNSDHTTPAGSSKADSGVQGMSSGNRSHEEVSVCSVASQVSPQQKSKLDQELKDVTAKLDEKKAAVLQAKRLLRSTTNELQKLTKLAEERAEVLRRLQSRMQSTSTVVSTPGGQEYKAGDDDDACHVRTTSSGFVPSLAVPSFSKTIRKVCYRKAASIVPKESLSTLASVSSIQNNFESSGSPPRLELHWEEASCDSDNVFEPTWRHEKQSSLSHTFMSKAAHLKAYQPSSEMGSVETPQKPHGGCSDYSKDKSHFVDTRDQRSERMFSFGCKQPMSLLDESSKAVTPMRTSMAAASTKKPNTLGVSTDIEDKSPVQKAISRSPWERDQCCKKASKGHVQSTPSYDFPLLGKSKVWNYVACDCNNPAPKQKQGARRSLTFPEEGVCPTVPSVHCSAGESDISLSVPQGRPFHGLPYPAPVNVTVHVQACPESKDSRR